MSQVLVTGGSGFIGAHCIAQALLAGHQVRTTLRNSGRLDEVKGLVARAGADGGGLTAVAADLMQDAGWAEAAAGCDYVLHVASPFPTAVPKDENEVIRPARDGALRVLSAARDAGVKRVVLTSSFAAVGYGHPVRTKPFDETDWTNLDGDDIAPYTKSKTLAERAAWDFIAREGGAMELAVVNPVGVMGPALGPDLSTSIEAIKRMLEGAMPGLPDFRFGIVDVRDVADLHLRAMTDPKARGERFLAVAGEFMSLYEIALCLKSRLGERARKVTTRQLPNWLVRTVALFDPMARQVTPELGKRKGASNAKAISLLGWSPRSREDAVAATGESLLALGIAKV